LQAAFALYAMQRRRFEREQAEIDNDIDNLRALIAIQEGIELGRFGSLLERLHTHRPERFLGQGNAHGTPRSFQSSCSCSRSRFQLN
jgi:hypothetical protein